MERLNFFLAGALSGALLTGVVIGCGIEESRKSYNAQTKKGIPVPAHIIEGRLHVAEFRTVGQQQGGAFVTVSSCLYNYQPAFRVHIREYGETKTFYDLGKDLSVDVLYNVDKESAQRLYQKYVPELFDTSGLAAKTFERW